MILSIVDNPEYVEAARLNMLFAPAEVQYVINEKLRGLNCFFWGGAVREPVYHAMYNGDHEKKSWKTIDWDILVDDSTQKEPLDLDAMFREELAAGKCKHNRYDTIKWKPVQGLEIDVSRFSNANMVRRKETQERSLRISLASCDFNTGAIAYGVRDGKLYDGGAMEGLRMRTVELHYADDDPHIIMARLVMHTNDMGFAIGQNATAFIRHRYTEGTFPAIDEDILKYLRAKSEEKASRYIEIVSRLKEITGIRV